MSWGVELWSWDWNLDFLIIIFYLCIFCIEEGKDEEGEGGEGEEREEGEGEEEEGEEEDREEEKEEEENKKKKYMSKVMKDYLNLERGKGGWGVGF